MKTFVVMLDNKHIRTIQRFIAPKVGDFIEDEIWVGKKIEGGKIVKILK